MPDDLTDILNYRIVTPEITLSGQPSEAQIIALAKDGVTDVLNLGPHDNNGALDDEPGSVAAAGMTYHYIPVDFENPTEADYALFTQTMTALKGRRLHVHCIFNARVSAFMLRYARDGFGDPAQAQERMDSIWRPGGVWAAFLNDAENTSLPNRFKGYEY